MNTDCEMEFELSEAMGKRGWEKNAAANEAKRS